MHLIFFNLFLWHLLLQARHCEMLPTARLFRVSLVTSITWSSSMTAPTTRELSCCSRSPTPSPPSPTSLPLCPRSLDAPSRASSAIIDAEFDNSSTHTLFLSRRLASNVVSLHFPAERKVERMIRTTNDVMRSVLF
jgi:hypothetical protein